MLIFDDVPEFVIRCEPGSSTYPVECNWHARHYFCDICQGYYGVPHDKGIREGLFAHPDQNARQCACRACGDRVVELRKSKEGRNR